MSTTSHAAMGAVPAAFADSKSERLKCQIDSDVTARRQTMNVVQGKNLVQQTVFKVTTHARVQNPWVFVGCTIGVDVDLLDVNGNILYTVSHDAYTGAWLDPLRPRHALHLARLADVSQSPTHRD